MIDAFALPFMQRALLGGLLVGFITSFYGPLVVQRRLAFLGSGLAHAAFGGVALGILLNTQPLWVAVPFTAAVAAAIVWVRERGRLATDTTIGVFFAVSMALGVIFLSLKKGYSADAFTYLFGSILAVSKADLCVTAGVALVTACLFPLWGRWAYATFDRDLARADRLPVLAHDYVLAMAVAVAVVVSMKVVGIVLVAAFLVLPAAAARLWVRRFTGMTVLAILIGTASVAAGLLLSYAVDLPSGPVIILVQAAVFGAGLIRRPG